MAKEKPKKGRSETIDLDKSSVKVILKRTSPIVDPPPKEEPAPKKPKKERMKDGTQPKGTGRGGNLPPPQWEKGQSGNPGGRPKDPEGMKEMRNLTKAELVRIGNMLACMTQAELLEYQRSGDATALHEMLIAIYLRIIDKGDMVALNLLFDRLIGKVKEELKGPPIGGQNSDGGTSVSVGGRVIFALPSNGREAPIKKTS